MPTHLTAVPAARRLRRTSLSNREPPRVRAVVVNHNGGDLTVSSLESLRKSDWPSGALQVVMVDNGSTDGVAARVRTALPEVRVIDAGGNLGFAGGCNLALADLDGVDYVALLNNDAQVDPAWLAPLVDALEADPAVGAANPKILFADRFVDVHLTSETGVRGLGDRRPLGVRLSGVRVDGQDAWDSLQLVSGFWGLEHGVDGDGPFEWTNGQAHLRVPAHDGALPGCELRLAADEERTVVLLSGDERTEHRVGPEPRWYRVALGGEPFDVLNNVGSVVLPDGHGADRGYLERDAGQFDQVEEVFAWCGAAVLLSRRYLEQVGLFDDRFFLYYEDFDLSWRGRAEGWRYLYVPDSVVRHVHSASSVEGSRLFQHFDERNRLLTLTRNAPRSLALREVGKHLLITGSYARRDIAVPLARRRPPSVETVRRRMRAYGAYVRLVPAALADR
ncbi:MAG: glycosyltransferase family 2 protein, partial [Actinomycetota bacterium]|nr:glycosyltransferase family 2 protein [Actinomycetota bacterium]